MRDEEEKEKAKHTDRRQQQVKRLLEFGPVPMPERR
jgi:hypothetical protein